MRGRLFISPGGEVDVNAEGPFSDAHCVTSRDGASFVVSTGRFTPLVLQHGWTNGAFGTRNAAVFSDDDGVIRFQGAINLCNSNQARLWIHPSGDVFVAPGTPIPAGCFASLEGVSYAR